MTRAPASSCPRAASPARSRRTRDRSGSRARDGRLATDSGPSSPSRPPLVGLRARSGSTRANSGSTGRQISGRTRWWARRSAAGHPGHGAGGPAAAHGGASVCWAGHGRRRGRRHATAGRPGHPAALPGRSGGGGGRRTGDPRRLQLRCRAGRGAHDRRPPHHVNHRGRQPQHHGPAPAADTDPTDLPGVVGDGVADDARGAPGDPGPAPARPGRGRRPASCSRRASSSSATPSSSSASPAASRARASATRRPRAATGRCCGGPAPLGAHGAGPRLQGHRHPAPAHGGPRRTAAVAASTSTAWPGTSRAPTPSSWWPTATSARGPGRRAAAAPAVFDAAIAFTGDNGDDDQFSILRCTFAGGGHEQTTGVRIDNTQSVWGQLTDCLFDDLGEGLRTSASTVLVNPQFNRCHTDLVIGSTAQVQARRRTATPSSPGASPPWPRRPDCAGPAATSRPTPSTWGRS